MAHFGERITPCGSACDACAGEATGAGTSGSIAVGATEPSPEAVAVEDRCALLRELRNDLAREANVPAFVVFTDATLLATARQAPRTKIQLLRVPGLGRNKLAAFGDRIIRAIARTAGR